MSLCKIKDKKKSAQGSLFYDKSLETSGGWDHCGVVSNFNLLEWSYQELMVFHQKRASSENMNKEMKYGYRLNNLPCQGLVANQAWFLFAMMAHNMLRLLSLMDNPETPRMSKKTRRKFIDFPERILNRSKKLWLKVPHQFYKGVIELIEGWRLPEKIFAHRFSKHKCGKVIAISENSIARSHEKVQQAGKVIRDLNLQKCGIGTQS